jgi:type I restriction enzyme S subunit
MSELRPGYQLTEYGTFPCDWQSVTVAATASRAPNAIVGGPFGSDLVSSDYTEAGVPVIRGQNMAGKFVSGEFAFVSSNKAKSLAANCAVLNDLIFTQRGTLGQVSIVPKGIFNRYVVSQSQMKLSVDRYRFNPEYIYYYFTSPVGQRQITDSAIQTGVPHTNLGILRKYRLPVPTTMLEQQAIAEALGDADALIEGLEALIAKKRDMKQGAMRDLLSGDCRLPGFHNDWRQVELQKVATFKKGKSLAKSQIIENGVKKCIHYGELFTRYGSVIGHIYSRTHLNFGMTLSRRNDVLMPTSDVTPNGLATASCIMEEGVVLGGDILIISPQPDMLAGAFLSNVIRLDRNQIMGLVSGSTVFHLYPSNMAKFLISIPPLAEQRAITAVLSDIDAEIIALEDKLAKASSVKQGMMQVLLTGEIRLI